MYQFFATHKKTFFAVVFLVLFGATVSSATPPLSPYTSISGTLDPQCLPGSPNCYIETALSLDGNNSLIVGGGASGAANNYSVYIGSNAGLAATAAANANFIGTNAGSGASSAFSTNFFGQNAGSGALNANNANFIGTNAGFGATGANNGNFFGAGAGYQATAASYSTLIGFKAGLSFSGNNIGSNNIIIGTNISLSDATADAINIGGVLFGTGTHSATMGNPNTSAVSGGRIGIGITDPQKTLDVAGSFYARGDNTTVTVDTPTNLQATQTCDDSCAYLANGGSHNWQIYSYKDTVAGRVYSASPLTLGSDFVDDGTNAQYDITVSWDAVPGADGYRILKLDPNYNSYNYDAGFDTVNNSFIDDNCGSICYDSASGAIAVSPTTLVVPNSFSQIDEPLLIGGGGRYINFGTTTGESGYGFRDNAGTVQYKNAGGDWEAFSSGGGGATLDANSSFILGGGAGASNSNFLGFQAGYNATDANNSNFLGSQAGFGATYAAYSNFFGNSAGTGASDATSSNFLGNSAGYNASNANDSNFFGSIAGSGATNASFSNFFGGGAGSGATNASFSNFFGGGAGAGATNASYSNLFGYNAGRNLGGNNIGSNNIIIGTNISLPDATANAINIGGVLFGTGTYSNTASNPSITPVSGGRIGIGVVSPNRTLDVNGNIGIASNGYLNFNTTDGASGYGIRDNGGTIQYKNAGGSWGGLGASLDLDSNSSFILGGGVATIATRRSVFIGVDSGQSATNAAESNFIGPFAGVGATNARNSNFFGRYAGNLAVNSSYSNFFGYQVANYHPSAVLGSNNIIIGTNITLPNAASNAINIGGVLFGTGTYSDTNATFPSFAPVSGGRIGIGVVSPAYTLDVGNASVSGIVARFQNSSGTCDINPTTSSLACSSDIILKKNITSLADNTAFTLTTLPLAPQQSLLTRLSLLTPVSYNWNTESDTDQKHAGFIAQQVEQVFPDLVYTDATTNLKSINYGGFAPYIVRAIQEAGIAISTVIPEGLDNTAYGKIKEFLRGIAVEGKITIQSIFVDTVDAGKIRTDELCIGAKGSETCLSQTQINKILENIQTNTSNTAIPSQETPNDTLIAPDVAPEETPKDEVTFVNTAPEE